MKNISKGVSDMQTVKWHIMHQNPHNWNVLRKGPHIISAPLVDSEDALLDYPVGAIDTYTRDGWLQWRKAKHMCPEYIIRDGKKIKVEYVTVLEIESGWEA